jgi:hypothetical protein
MKRPRSSRWSWIALFSGSLLGIAAATFPKETRPAAIAALSAVAVILILVGLVLIDTRND